MSKSTSPCDLGGLSVLVTRPAHQADHLCELIEQAHGRPVRFPAMEIRGPADKHAARAQLKSARHAQLLVFVSANAVRYAFPLLPDQLPLDVAIGAVGRATAQALADAGLDATLVPERMDSEGLLALPALQAVQGKRVYILRGNGGRELLTEVLRERGAEVRAVEVYRRQVPANPPGIANLVSNWDRMAQIVTATSNAILDNLFSLLGEQGAALLRRTPLVVASQRMAEHAIALRCEAVYVAASAGDPDIVATLCAVAEDVV